MPVRPAAVSGTFYPEKPGELSAWVAAALAQAKVVGQVAPKALVVPHAGFVYSGHVAASAFAQWRGLRPPVRVVLVGPAHHVGIDGLALPDAEAVATPLGEVGVDSVAASLGVPRSNPVHAREHSLEVQLPFLQAMFGTQFTLVPLAAGHRSEAEVERVLDALWEGSRILISTDLSHFLSFEAAQALDARTAQAVVTMDAAAIDDEQACGNAPLRGFLRVARRRRMRGEILDLRNSGDAFGDRRRVVGYGAFAFWENAEP